MHGDVGRSLRTVKTDGDMPGEFELIRVTGVDVGLQGDVVEGGDIGPREPDVPQGLTSRGGGHVIQPRFNGVVISVHPRFIGLCILDGLSESPLSST